MKNTKTILGGLLLFLLFTSCKKEMQCQCVFTSTEGYSLMSSKKYDTKQVTTKQAKEDCKQREQEIDASKTTTGVSCRVVVEHKSTMKPILSW
jgi:glutamate synthase domain-containing protein 1